MVPAVIAGALVVATAMRCRSVGLHRPQHLAAIAGVLLFTVVTAGPLGTFLTDGGLALHVLQHLLIFSLAGSALVVASRGAARQPMRPAVAAACLTVGVGVFWLTLLAPALRLGIQMPALDALQHATLLGAGALLALPLVGAARLEGFGAAVFLVACEIAIGAAGIVLAWSPELLYGTDVLGESAIGLSPATDQALAGAFVLVLEEPLLAIEFAAAFIAGLVADEARQAREDALAT